MKSLKQMNLTARTTESETEELSCVYEIMDKHSERQIPNTNVVIETIFPNTINNNI